MKDFQNSVVSPSTGDEERASSSSAKRQQLLGVSRGCVPDSDSSCKDGLISLPPPSEGFALKCVSRPQHGCTLVRYEEARELKKWNNLRLCPMILAWERVNESPFKLSELQVQVDGQFSTFLPSPSRLFWVFFRPTSVLLLTWDLASISRLCDFSTSSDSPATYMYCS